MLADAHISSLGYLWCNGLTEKKDFSKYDEEKFISDFSLLDRLD